MPVRFVIKVMVKLGKGTPNVRRKTHFTTRRVSEAL